MGISIESLHLDGRGLTRADIEAAIAQAPPRPLLPPEAEESPLAASSTPGYGGQYPQYPPDLAPILAAAPRPFIRYRSKTEARFAATFLDFRISTQEIAWWAYEPLKLKLADRCTYTPDFLVILPNRELWLYEVKGRKDDGWHATEKARVKLRVAAALFPFPLVVCWPLKGGGWGEERIGSADQRIQIPLPPAVRRQATRG